MKIRTQLILACFLLSILPLAGIVLYSYDSSRRALEAAYQSEAAHLTHQMDHRLATIRSEIEQRLADVSALPLESLPGGKMAAEPAMASNVLMALGDTAPMVDSLEFQPMGAHPATAAIPAVAPTASPAPTPMASPDPDSPDTDEADKEDSNDSSAEESIVIDIPEHPNRPHFRMPQDARDHLHEISRLSGELGRKSAAMTEQQREELQRQINAQQKAFDDAMQAENQKFNQALQVSLQAEEKARELKRQQWKAGVPTPPELPAAAEHPAPPQPSASPGPSANDEVTIQRLLTSDQKAELRKHKKQASLLFGHSLHMPVRNQGAVVARLSAQVNPEEVIRRVLGAESDGGEISFAADRDGNLYTRTPADREKLDQLGVSRAIASGAQLPKLENWVIVVTKDPQNELRVGVARPVGDDLGVLRRAAGFNFVAGMALVFLALAGIAPFANHITRDIKLVTAGAERIAQGDLMTRLPIKSRNEVGQLSAAFNKMAEDLSRHQMTIIEQERTRKEQEMHQHLLALEYDRKSVELEDARRFQLSMLPKFTPQRDELEIAVLTQTATEVGGDYYDFHDHQGSPLTVTVGDATGHGAKAGTMVTVVKTLFAAYAGDTSPSAFLRDSAEKIKRMELGRMAMSLLLARLEPRQMTVASAGMPPVLLHRGATASVEELVLAAPPLGTLESEYVERTVSLAAGDTVLFMTDGFPELLNSTGQQLGYPAALEAFAAAALLPTAFEVLASLAEAARRWRGDLEQNDDITFLAVRVR